MPQALLVERVPRRDLPLIPSSATATEEVAKTRQKQRQWGGGGGGGRRYFHASRFRCGAVMAITPDCEAVMTVTPD